MTPDEDHSVWVAASRAVRTPNRIEHDIRVTQIVFPPDGLYSGSPVTAVSMLGDSDFESEELYAYEVGYRVYPLNVLSIDTAAFYNIYDNLRTVEPSIIPYMEPLPTPHLVIPYIADNKMRGETYGVELAVDWQAFDWWHFKTAYTYLIMHLTLDKSSEDMISKSAGGESPRHQLSLRSSMDLLKDMELDLWMRYVDKLRSQNVDSYLTLDARIGWSLMKNLELSVTGQNLLNKHHLEYEQELYSTTPNEIERSVYGKVVWRF